MSPFMSAANTATPAAASCSARSCTVTVLPVPVAPAISPWRFIIAIGICTIASWRTSSAKTARPSASAPPSVAYASSRVRRTPHSPPTVRPSGRHLRSCWASASRSPSRVRGCGRRHDAHATSGRDACDSIEVGRGLRVVAGAARGVPLVVPDGARPTTGRVREAVFSALGDIAGCAVLDLFAGSGAFAFEALSRGAAHALLVDGDPRSADACRRNLEATGLADRGRVQTGLVSALLDREPPSEAPFDLVSLDPPYETTADDVAGVVARARRPAVGWRPGRGSSSSGPRAAAPSRCRRDGRPRGSADTAIRSSRSSASRSDHATHATPRRPQPTRGAPTPWPSPSARDRSTL